MWPCVDQKRGGGYDSHELELRLLRWSQLHERVLLGAGADGKDKAQCT